MTESMVLPQPQKWDIQTDVVVVGSGGAGLSAAIGALEAGAKVTILEKHHRFGGTTRRSWCAIWAPNSSVSLAAGVNRSREEVITYLNQIGGGQQEPALIDTFLDQAPAWIDHLIKVTNGTLKFKYVTSGSYFDKPGAVMNEGAFYPEGNGVALIDALEAVVREMGANTMVSSPATALYKDSSARIVGVRATTSNSGVSIQAAKGVILAAGGFDWNQDMMSNFMRGPIDYSGAPKSNTGDGVIMAMEAGADMRNMNNCWGQPHYLTPERPWLERGENAGRPGAITVNRFGKRFVNESTSYPNFNRAFHLWDTTTQSFVNNPAYTIFDSGARERYRFVGVDPGQPIPAWIAQGETLRELANALNIDPPTLEETVTRFNANAAFGVDPDFRRGEGIYDKTTAGDWTREDLKNGCVAPLTKPPFFGIQIHPATIGTCGGPRINSNGQVLDRNGAPIRGLYAAGNNAASPFGAGYATGGATIGPATLFGWLAGKSAGSS